MINWHDQWALHAPNFQDGLAHITLKGGKQFYLKPGPGFGDLSHPTTRLVLEIMVDHVDGKTVVDLGCGSGILALSAAILNAKEIHGIDICDEAIAHAKENALLNNLSNVRFGRTAKLKLSSNILLLINMISSEQETAWQQHPYLHDLEGLAISSGILIEQKEAYIIQAAKRGWAPISSKDEGEWTALLFKMNNLSDCDNRHSHCPS